MFPILHSDHARERKMQATALMRDLAGDVPRLDLGKKVSTPQDLMVEELALQKNRGSQLFQQRQKRVQKFILERPTRYRTSAEGKENYHTELHVAAAGQGGPPQVPKKTNKVLQMSKALNPGALAPGYSGPLHEVPPEKFNFTAIPKGYSSPWQEFLSSEDYQADRESQLPDVPRKPNHSELRSFNRTPTPFGGALLQDMFPAAGLEMEAQPDSLNSLELVWNRPSFNRAARGWVQIVPESEEL
ncbi:myozenin-3 [Emydura macquarii macquarii]|uniref:myozenin-3 n=1 Tax=Emydura macquarii macquarii TaxID=1129001 RepID=UPI00352A52B3